MILKKQSKSLESLNELNIRLNKSFYKDKEMSPQEFYDKLRNDVIEEVAKEFDKLTNGGDTTASFAIFIRRMKRD